MPQTQAAMRAARIERLIRALRNFIQAEIGSVDESDAETVDSSEEEHELIAVLNEILP